jgi:formylglycine-generating enzyme required for sulfatase activity
VSVGGERRDAIAKLAGMTAAGTEPRIRREVGNVTGEPLALALVDGQRPIEERCELAVVLGLIGDTRSITALRRVMGEEGQHHGLRRAAAEALGLSTESEDQSEARGREIEAALEELLRNQALAGESEWNRIDVALPLLQGAARGLQLRAARHLRVLGTGPGRVVPMLTLTRSKGAVTTELVDVPVWKLPLPKGEQLELVVVPGGDYTIGSPQGEVGKQECYEWTPESKAVDKEPLRTVRLAPLAMARFPITQAQWAAVAGEGKGMEASPGTYKAEGLWEAHGQPGCLPVDSVSWNLCQEWLAVLNRWLAQHWRERGFAAEVPELRLPSESEWEVACRAGTHSPFHFGDSLDTSWANYDGNYSYGSGRPGGYRKRPMAIGAFGLVNRWGLADMHGQMYEWCGDRWHPSPLRRQTPQRSGWLGGLRPQRRLSPEPQAALAWEETDRSPQAEGKREFRLLRGGSWLIDPHYCRAAYRVSSRPGVVNTSVGVRPCCLLPPGSLLGP